MGGLLFVTETTVFWNMKCIICTVRAGSSKKVWPIVLLHFKPRNNYLLSAAICTHYSVQYAMFFSFQIIMGVIYCAAGGCHNNKKACPGMSFFRVPKDPERWKKWIINSRRDKLLEKGLQYCNKYIYFCPDHFEPSQFMNDKKNKLVWNAVPSLFAVPNPPPRYVLLYLFSFHHLPLFWVFGALENPSKLFRLFVWRIYIVLYR